MIADWAAMNAVSEVQYSLRKLSNLCHALGAVNERDCIVSAEDMADCFQMVRDLLDTQIAALEQIEWKHDKTH